MNRESYIGALATELRPLFHSNGATFPELIRYTCGWPSRGAGSRRKTLGQCFDASASKDGHFEIIIGMSLDDPMEVAHVLAHELCHAVVGTKHGHKGPFRKLALAIGLEGKMTSTMPGESFTRFTQPLLDRLGPYPHAELDYSSVKKQATRMIKATCRECEYTARLTRKWLDAGGPPICPIHDSVMIAKGFNG
jgi:hypothetical protein